MKELSQYKQLNKKIQALEMELSKKPGFVADVVNDYSTGYPVPLKIEGAEVGGIYTRLQKSYMEAIKQRKEIEDKIDSLPPDLYAIASLYYIQGKTQEEVADILHYSERQVRRLLEKIKSMS